jgi:drug/metabolite transporter (DMT)-like permease
VVGAQVAFGCAALWGLAAAQGAIKTIAPRSALRLVLLGVPSGVTGTLYYGAVHALESASLGVILLFQFTWMGFFLDALVTRRRPRRDQLFALVLIGVGTVLATGLSQGGFHSLDGMGVLLGLGSAASYTAVLFGTGRYGLEADPWLRSAFMGTGAMLTVFVLHPPVFLIDGTLMRGLLVPGLAAALLGPIIPTLCFTRGIPKTGTALASILGAAELPVAMIAARLVLGEPTSFMQWLGASIILVGIALPEARVLLHARRVTASR